MIIQDRIYGKYTIDEPILLELIESPAFQRLKGISQYGIPDEFYFYTGYQRYEHCIGVMILLRELGASLEEQIAGLLHDVSHTAFSHLIDWVIAKNDNKEEYADSQHRNFLIKNGIDTILKKYGYDFDIIADCHQFSLLEKEIPNICADRIDYALRQFTFVFHQENHSKYKENFIVSSKQIICKNQESALWFATRFLFLQENFWACFEGTSRYKLLSEALKIGITKKILTLEDFWQDDAFVIQKLQASKKSQIHTILSALRNKSLAYLPTSSEPTYKKFRYVDPLFLEGNEVKRLSEVNANFKEKLEQARIENNKGIFCAKIDK